MKSRHPKPNGSLSLDLGWKGGFQSLVFVGGPFDAFPHTKCDFGVCVRAELVPANGVDVHLPIEDFDVPHDAEHVREAATRAIRAALEGKRVYVGCMGGWGRTGLFMALLAKVAGIADPVAYVRDNYTPRAVETDRQLAWVRDFDVKSVRAHVLGYAWHQTVKRALHRLFGRI